MPFHLIESPYDPTWNKRGRRVLIVGNPNTGKTASAPTFLETPQDRMAYLCLPGEFGNSSLPITPQIKPWIWDEDDPTRRVAWADIWKQIEETLIAILTGKHGKFDTLFLDGLHKLHEISLNKVTGGEAAVGLGFDAKLYDDARKLTMKLLQMIFRANIRNLVVTVWAAREKDDPDATKARETTTHIAPDLPGQFAGKIVGEFGCVLYALTQGYGEKATKYLWQTRQSGKVWGVGIKAPIVIARQIKTFIPQDWRQLTPLLFPNQKEFERLAALPVEEEAADPVETSEVKP